MNKETILQNVTKQEFMSVKFLKANNITSKECFDIVNKPSNCKFCSSESEFISYKHGYKVMCISKPCKNKLRKEKTCVEKYGVKNISQLDSIKQSNQIKMKATCMKKYGVENVFQSKELSYDENGKQKAHSDAASLKRRDTLIERYDTTDPLSINNGREKGIYKCNNDYDVSQKRKNTCVEKYGVETVFHSKEIQDIIKLSNLEKYGFENPMYDEDIKLIHKIACEQRDIARTNDVDENGLNAFHRASIKMVSTKINDVDENGLNAFHRASIKMVSTKINDVDENGLNAFHRASIKMVSTKTNDIDENGLNAFHRACIKSKETNIKNGYWVSDDDKTEYELYHRACWKYTNRKDLSVLENIELRGHANKGMYHLDHRYSIFQGFVDDVPPEIIGSLYNLEMLIARNNLIKSRKCSITLEELLNET